MSNLNENCVFKTLFQYFRGKNAKKHKVGFTIFPYVFLKKNYSANDVCTLRALKPHNNIFL